VISVVIPARNEAGNIAATLAPLQALRGRGHEVLVAERGTEPASVIRTG